MKIRFESAWVYHKEYLAAWIQIIPEPMDKSYDRCHVWVPESEGSSTLVEQVNPCLTKSVLLDLSTTKDQLITWLGSIFNKDTITKIDDLLSQDKVKEALAITSTKPVMTVSKVDRVNLKQIDNKLSGLEIRV